MVTMKASANQLLAAFQRDHAILGRGLHRLGVALRDSDILSAKRVAADVDRDAGPHIAFEEQYFYPRMRALLGDEDLDRLYAEHRIGQAAISRILTLPDAAWPDGKHLAVLLRDVELMERHIAECGELFGAMGRIPAEEQVALLAELEALRESAPCWTKLEPAGLTP